MSLRAESKATYVLAIQALCQRFPTHINDNAERAVKARALAEMDALTQGDLTSEEYIERANDLFAILGEDQSRALATKFMDRIKDSGVQVTVDSQVEEPYNDLPDMLRIFDKSTRSTRRRETTRLNVAEEGRQAPTDPALILVEAMKYNQQMVCQVGDLIKEFQLSRQSASNHRNPQLQIRYQPIVGTMSQQANANRMAAVGYQPAYNQQSDNQQA